MFTSLENMRTRPAPFEVYTTPELWNDPHISEQMLSFHLDGGIDLASRNTKFVQQSLAWLRDVARITPGTKVLDLGCGPGLYSNPLAQHGANVLGIDLSSRSIDHATTESVATRSGATFIEGNYLSCDIAGKFDVALLLMWDLCALSPAQRHTLLRRIASLLTPEGCLIFDVYGLRRLDGQHESVNYEPQLMNGFWSPHRYYGFHHTFRYPAEAVTLDRYDIVEASGTRTFYNWSQHFSAESLARELEACGLEVQSLWGDIAGRDLSQDPNEFCVVAGPAGGNS